MKRIFQIILALLFTASFTGCGYDAVRYQKDGVWIYSQNYIEKYTETLNVMFQNDWNVLKEEKKSWEGRSRTDDLPLNYYTEWTLQYYDADGEEKLFILNNYLSFSEQLQDHIEKLAASFYSEHFFQSYLGESDLARIVYVNAFFENISFEPQSSENKPKVKAIEKYQKSLEKPDTTICLSELTPEQLFRMCPIYLSGLISLDSEEKNEEEKRKSEEYAKAKVEAMITAMCEYTNQTVNAEICIVKSMKNSAEYDKNSWNWYYAGGNALSLSYPYQYEQEIYKHYASLFEGV